MRKIILTTAVVAAFGLGGLFAQPPGGDAQANSHNIYQTRDWAKCVLDNIKGASSSDGAARLLSNACRSMTR